MRSWFFENIPAFKPEVGFETGFDVQSQRRNFHHLWRVTEVIPNRKLTYQWKYREYPGDSFVTFELSTEDGKTKLTLTALVVEDFPDDIPEFRRESCLAGWTYFIQDRLKTFLDRYR
jgi:uncharacterized protein YndB with AHSA1/START domain